MWNRKKSSFVVVAKMALLMIVLELCVCIGGVVYFMLRKEKELSALSMDAVDVLYYIGSHPLHVFTFMA